MSETITVSKPVSGNGREWVDSHNYVKALQNKLAEIQKDKELSKHNKQALLNYFRRMANKRPPTVLKNMQVVYKFLLEMKKDMGDTITKEDCDKYYLELINNTKLKPWSIKKYLLCIRRFFRVYYGMKPGHYPEQVDNWDTEIDTRQYLDPDELPTQEQIKHAIENCNVYGSMLEARNQFLIALLNDAGCRISEALALNVGDIKETTYDGFELLLVKFTQSKTFPRTVVSILSRPYLKRYLALRGITKNNVEEKANDPLFIDRYKKRSEYRAVIKFVDRAFEKIGYYFPRNRKVHLFRHVWLTRAGEYFRFAQKNYWCGQSGGHVSTTYTHFNWKKVVKPYLEMIVEEKNPMMVLKCECGHENAGQEFCVGCGNTLAVSNAVNQGNILNVFKKFAGNLTEEELEQYLLRVMKKHKVEINANNLKEVY